MSLTAWIMVVLVAIAVGALGAVAGYTLWQGATTIESQHVLVEMATRQQGLLFLIGLALMAVPAFAVASVYRRFTPPLAAIAEEVRVMAVSNPRHRLSVEGDTTLRRTAESVNLLGDRYCALQEDLNQRIREANTALEEERNILAALMSKLTQGVVVCNPEGRILLYNQRAQRLLQRTAADGHADWIGLGRSIFGLLEEGELRHALEHIEHRLEEGHTAILVPFVARRADDQVLNVHVVPILDGDNAFTGYILTLEDITRRFNTESRRGTLLQSLTQGQRSGIASMRAAIEIVTGDGDMDDASRRSFLEVIQDEALRMSANLDHLEREYASELSMLWHLEDVLSSDLLATLHRRALDALSLDIEVSVPLEPVWVRVDSYAIAHTVVFLIERVTPVCRAGDFGLHLESGRSLVSLVLSWSGAALDLEALRSWGERNVVTRKDGASLSLFDIVERHGGAFWTDPDTAHGHAGVPRPGIRLILPLSDIDPGIAASLTAEEETADFDFRLLNQRKSVVDPLDMPLGELTCTVIDTETTGLDPDKGDEIIAIAAIRIIHGRLLRREVFDHLVNPQRNISAASHAIHGITPAMLRGQPKIQEVLPRFHRFVADTVIIGHNVGFDLRFLRMKETALNLTFPNAALDTLMLEHVLHPHQTDKSLEAIAGRYGIEVTGRHTAMGDALTTAEIFIAMIPVLADRGILTLRQAIAECEAHPLAGMNI